MCCQLGVIMEDNQRLNGVNDGREAWAQVRRCGICSSKGCTCALKCSIYLMHVSVAVYNPFKFGDISSHLPPWLPAANSSRWIWFPTAFVHPRAATVDRMPGGVPLRVWPIVCAAVSFSPSHIPWQYSGSCTWISAGAPPTGSSCSIQLFEGIAESRHKTHQSALCRFAVFSLCLTLFLLSQFLRQYYVTSHFCTSHPRTYLVGIHFMQITLGSHRT